MAISEGDQKNIEGFWTAIMPFEQAYENDTFAYLAVRSHEGLTVVQGSLVLNVTKQPPRTTFSSESIQAGRFHLAELKMDRRQFLQRVFSGTIPSPDGELLFPPNQQRYGTWLQSFHPEGLKTQSRLGVLSVRGMDSGQQTDWAAIDWELRSSPTPFDGIQDVLYEFQLGARRGGPNSIEVVALTVAGFDERSTIEGEIATAIVRVAPSLPVEKVSLGYRALQQGRVLERKLVASDQFSWSQIEGARLGKAEFRVPVGSVVHAFVRSGGIAQQFFWIASPTAFQNPRRAAYQTFDPKLEALHEIYSRVRNVSRGTDTRELEKVMAWLFWMLGFSAAHLGNMPKTQDAVDVLLCTPKGHFVVMECTTGLLKGENKLPRLHERTLALRRSLDNSNSQHLRILPVLVTTKLLDDVRPELSLAEESGIYVIAQEAIDQLINGTLGYPQPDTFFERAEETVKAAQARQLLEGAQNGTPELPGLVH